MASDSEIRAIHSRELPNRNLHPDQFGPAGHGPIGLNSLNRTGGIGGTEMSADAHDIQDSSRRAAKDIETGAV